MENMNATQFLNSTATAVNGERSKSSTDNEFLKNLPPGFHFSPTDEELIASYLIKKVNNQKLPLNLINDVNVYKFHPQTLSEKYKLEGENDMYFFGPRERKYKNGKRPSRAAQGGYWRATGADKPIKLKNGKEIGCKKSLVFLSGHPPDGQKTSWLMQEFMVKNLVPRQRTHEGDMTLDDWVLCKIHYNDRKLSNKKKNRQAEEMCDQETCNGTNEVLISEQETAPEPKSCSNNMGDSNYNNFSYYLNPDYCSPNVESCPSIHPDRAGGTSRAINPSLISAVMPGYSGIEHLPAVGQVHQVNNNGNLMMWPNFGAPSYDIVPDRWSEEEANMVDNRLLGSSSLARDGPVMIIRRLDQEKRKVDSSGRLSGSIAQKPPSYGYKRSRYSDN